LSTSVKAEQKAEARLWLPYADSDMAAARVVLGNDPPLLDAAAYHCQQAVEKLLKALLVLASRPLRKIHDLDTLTGEAEEVWPGVRALAGDAVLVTRWGFAYRYPHAGPVYAVPPTREQVDAVLADAERLRSFLLERLG
jgi:HEPN domain-containing protein